MQKKDKSFKAPPMVLFFDDFPVAHQQVQAACFKLFHEGQAGDLHIRDNVFLIAARLSLYGQNILSQQKKTPLWEKLLHELLRPPALVLLVVGLVAFLAFDAMLALIIWSIIVVNTGFSFWREYRAEQAIEKLRAILPSFAHIIRAGGETYIPSSQVVPGDVLVLAEGDNVAADARVIEEYGLRTNNATLTGEAIPSRKTADASYQTGISELDRPTLIFAGTS